VLVFIEFWTNWSYSTIFAWSRKCSIVEQRILCCDGYWNLKVQLKKRKTWLWFRLLFAGILPSFHTRSFRLCTILSAVILPYLFLLLVPLVSWTPGETTWTVDGLLWATTPFLLCANLSEIQNMFTPVHENRIQSWHE
jgi:hypothetical protein